MDDNLKAKLIEIPIKIIAGVITFLIPLRFVFCFL